MSYPQRIVCLSDETTEILYLLGEQNRIVGISGFTTRPREARLKPKVSAFNNANYDSILKLKPDLVLTFSDVQAEITRELVLRGLTVFNFNQRSIAEILDTILMLSAIVGKTEHGVKLVETFREGLQAIETSAQRFTYRPRVFFEEWKDPLISGIELVEELVQIAGGEPIFPELRKCHKSRDRSIAPAAVLARNPEVILASWCGMKVNKQEICSRPGWSSIDAVQNELIYEIQSSLILQPGPAALTEGVRQIHALLARVLGATVDLALTPVEVLDADLACGGRK